MHGAAVRRHEEATPGVPYLRPPDHPTEVDGHTTSAVGLAPLVLVADCLPVALSGPAGVAMLHCGWRGLAAGIVEAGVRETGATAAAIGPGIGPCCFEVGEEVLAAFEDLGDGIAAGRMLDLAEVAARRLDSAGVTEIDRTDLCTSCQRGAVLLAPPRRWGHGPPSGNGGSMAELIRDIDPGVVRTNLERVRARTGESVRILVATKYVPDEELPALAEAGVELVGENRLQDLERKQDVAGGGSSGTSSGHCRAGRSARSCRGCA